MRAVIIRSLAFATVAYLLTGCQTIRTATFPDKGYDMVYKNTIKGLCTDPGLIVYEADKEKGTINVMTAGLFGGQIINVTVASPGSESPVVTAMCQGLSPFPDRMISAITQQVMNGKEDAGAKKKKKTRKVVVIEEDADESSTPSATKQEENAKPAEPKAAEPAPTPEGKKKGSLF